MTEAQEKFIKDAGDKWQRALAAATIHIRNDRHFVGMDKIREPAILSACFDALGADTRLRPTCLAKMLVDASPDVTRRVDKMIADAADVARDAVKKHLTGVAKEAGRK